MQNTLISKKSTNNTNNTNIFLKFLEGNNQEEKNCIILSDLF